ncbi:MAG: winged helix-turn-helix transcriptional regulator [Ruminiclostridium sp.]|jgi:DNA-binding MarR family transcriptional regulator|nr:winged helix-turn-helix transcriptional regulator [Ruminiclostridium sp.]
MDGNESARRLAKAACALDGAYDRLAKRLGITGNLLWLLYILDDGAPHSQKQICEEWLFPKTTVNTLTKECQGAGYITLHTIPGKKRELHIQLTDAGRDYVHQKLRAFYQAEEAALQVTLETCPPEFVSYLETYTQNLIAAFGAYENRKEPK